MCRWLAYVGRPIALCDLLTRPDHSLTIAEVLRHLPPESLHDDIEPELLSVLENAKAFSSELRKIESARPDLGTDDFAEEVTSLDLEPSGEAPAKLGYSILGKIGSGGMGVVFTARDPDLDRIVAIKVMRPHAMRNEASRKRFLREARAAAAVHHPHVCPIYDVGEHRGAPYVVMAMVDGESLEHRLRHIGRFDSADDAVAIARQVADAMEAVHAHGIVHRDLKPANILMDSKGDAVVTDFGLALVNDTSERLTVEGSVWGTPAYMAPEQASGQFAQVGAHSDVYSLGAILYDLLTGQTPFSGPTLQVLSQVVNEEPPRPSEVRPDLDKDLENIVLKALTRQPENRFQTTGEMSEALGDWLTQHGTVAIPGDPRDTVAGASSEPNSAARVKDSDVDSVNETVSMQMETRSLTKRRRTVAIATAAALLVVAALAATPQVRKLIIRDKDGNKKAELTLDNDDTVELQDDGKPLVKIPGRDGQRGGTTERAKQDARVRPISETPTFTAHGRVTKNLELLYLFQEGDGDVVHDASGVGEPLDLRIADESNVRWIPRGGLAFEVPNLAASGRPATKVIEACQASNELTVEVWIRPRVRNHTGLSPARIVSLSKDPLSQNLVFGQTGAAIEARLRTISTNLLGQPATTTPWDSEDGRLTHGVLTRDESGEVRVYVDGQQRAHKTVAGDFSNWASDQLFCLGNEPTENRPWLGAYFLVAVYSRALTEKEIFQNYMAPSGAFAITCLSRPNAEADEAFEVTWTDRNTGDGILTWYCSTDREGKDRQRIVTLFHDDFEDGATDRWQPWKTSQLTVVQDPRVPGNLVVRGENKRGRYLGSSRRNFTDVVASARILVFEKTKGTAPGVAVHFDPANDPPTCYRVRYVPTQEGELRIWKHPGNLSLAATDYKAPAAWVTYEIAIRHQADGVVELDGWAISTDRKLLARVTATDVAKESDGGSQTSGGIALYGLSHFDDVYVDALAARLLRDRENRFRWDTSRLPDGEYS